MSHKIRVIGIAGVARSGKDTMAKALRDVLVEQSPGLKVEIRSFATPLKADLKDFIQERFDIDVFTNDDGEKSIIRPLLVAYGGAKRRQSKGTYWTGLMTKELERLDGEGVNVVIVPDVRYCEYEEDEIAWIYSQGGFLVHVEKILADGSTLLPPNEDEMRNDPILKKAADYAIEWPEQDFDACKEVARALLGVDK